MALYGAGVEYALHTMVNLCIGSHAGAPSARELAEFQMLPVAFTRRLLTQLEKAGLLRSTEGIGGGWVLARDATQVTVLDVVDAVHEGGPLFSCTDVRQRCALWADGRAPRSVSTGRCSIHAVMLSAEIAMREQLNNTTIADLAEQLAEKSGARALQAVPVWFDDRRARRRQSSPTKRKPTASR